MPETFYYLTDAGKIGTEANMDGCEHFKRIRGDPSIEKFGSPSTVLDKDNSKPEDVEEELEDSNYGHDNDKRGKFNPLHLGVYLKRKIENAQDPIESSYSTRKVTKRTSSR